MNANKAVESETCRQCENANKGAEEHGNEGPEEHSNEELEAAEGLLQLLQDQPNYNGPKSFRDFEVQVNAPKISTLCDLLITNSAINSFTGISSAKVLDTIVEAVQFHYVDQRSHRLTIKERIVLCLTKLKCDLTYVTLSVLFQTPIM